MRTPVADPTTSENTSRGNRSGVVEPYRQLAPAGRFAASAAALRSEPRLLRVLVGRAVARGRIAGPPVVRIDAIPVTVDDEIDRGTAITIELHHVPRAELQTRPAHRLMPRPAIQ